MWHHICTGYPTQYKCEYLYRLVLAPCTNVNAVAAVRCPSPFLFLLLCSFSFSFSFLFLPFFINQLLNHRYTITHIFWNIYSQLYIQTDPQLHNIINHRFYNKRDSNQSHTNSIIVTNFPTQTQISHHKNESTKYDFTRLRLLRDCTRRPPSPAVGDTLDSFAYRPLRGKR
jgi:hypothetical protein